MKTTLKNTKMAARLGMGTLTRWMIAAATCALLSVNALATDVKFTLGPPYFNASPASNRVVTLQALNPFRGNLVSYTSDTNGVFYSSNMAVGDYAGVIKPKGFAGQIEFMITVTATNLGVVNAHEITSLGSVQTYPISGRTAWTIQASDARYSPIGAGGLSFTPQLGAANLTNWAALATNVLSGLGGGSGTYNYASLTNLPVPIASLATNNGSSLTNLQAAAVTGTLTNSTTGSASAATWATNLNAPYGFSQILVSSPTNNSVESHGGFTYTQSTNTSVLVVGDAWDIGNPLARRGIITLFDPTAELEATITITNGRLTFPDGIELRGDIQNYTRINGIQHNLLNPQWHNSIEPIYYWGGPTLSAQAWMVGSFEEGLTNGRFSFLVGETGLSWNIGRSTNGGVDQSFLVAGTSTNIASWMSGPSGPELKAALTYRHDDNRNIIGGVSRGTTVAGTNVVLGVGTNSITVATNAITVLGDVTLGSSAYGIVGLSFWDSLEESYKDFRYDVDTEAFRLGGGLAAVGNIISLGSGVFTGNGSGLTNLNAAAVAGDLSINSLTATTLNVDAINGNGSGITNSPYALFHETLANNVAPRFIAQVAWTNVIFTTNSFNSDTAGAFTQSNSFLIVNAAGAGTWKVRGNVVIYNNSGNTGAVTPRLYRWSSASTLIAGLTAYQYNYNSVVAGVVGVVTLTAGDILGLQVFAANTTTTTVGRQQNSGIDASSAYIEFERK